MNLTWNQGDHHGLVWPRGAALLDGSVEPAAVNAVHARLGDGVALTEFFTMLSEETGRSLLELPGFAVAVLGATGAHVAARGGFVVRTRGHESAQEVSGAGVSTWSEARVDSLDVIELLALDQASGDEPSLSRPITGGVVPAAALTGRGGPAPAAAEPAEIGVPAAAAEILVEGDASMTRTPEPEEEPVPEAETTHTPEPDQAEMLDPSAPSAADAPFGHLWVDHTTHHLVEDAAVRTSGEGLVGLPEIADPMAEPAMIPGPAEEDTGDEVADAPADAPARRSADRPGSDLSVTLMPSVAEEDLVVPDSRSASNDVRNGRADTSPEPEGLITSVPFTRPTSAASAPATAEGPLVEEVPASRQGMPDADLGEEHLGHPEEAERQEEKELPEDLEHVAHEEDHDGMTTLGLIDPSLPGPRLLAVLCGSGHANPTHRATCRVCQEPLGGPSQQIDVPLVGVMTTSDGQRIELSGPVRVGRDPRATRFQGDVPPRLLPMPHAHVSANHLEIQVEGWSVMVQDLRSTNGSYLRRHGEPPVRLPETPQVLVSEDVVDLGHGVHLTFSELP